MPSTIDRDEFERLYSLIKPKPDDRLWSEIPWELTLSAARKKAMVENRPMLVWAMNGYPLGIT